MFKNDAAKKIDEVVLEYLKAATAASDRSRAVLLVMITASVLVFTVIWNTGGWSPNGGGWLDARIELREAALEYFDTKSVPAGVAEDDRELHARAARFFKRRGFDPNNDVHRTRLQNEADDLNKIRTEQVRIIRVPFFGVIFDMNDLGLFAGITFTVVLLWLTFSVARERRNLRLAFDEADERGQSKLCYDLLTMHQVLTVPPMRKQSLSVVWNAVPKLLYLIPAGVYYLQYKTDGDSYANGFLLSPAKMEILVRTNFMFLTLILILTALCVMLSLSTDRIWRTAYREAYPPEPKGEGAKEEPAPAPPPSQAGEPVTP